MAGYVIFATPRSGSNYLCELLTNTGLLGRPQEYFNPYELRRQKLPPLEGTPEEQVARVLELAGTPNGVYGVKIFTKHFDAVAQLRWAERMPDWHPVVMGRDDLLDQAISLARAKQTLQYRSYHAATREAVYDAAAILAALQELASSEARWRMYFARNNLQPLRLSYESFTAAPQAAVRAVAALVGVELATVPAADSTPMRIQRDAMSQEWRERYLREEGDPCRLDRLR